MKVKGILDLVMFENKLKYYECGVLWKQLETDIFIDKRDQCLIAFMNYIDKIKVFIYSEIQKKLKVI